MLLEAHHHRCFQLLLLLLKDIVVRLVLLKLFLAAIQQQFPEVDCAAWLVCHGHFQLWPREGAERVNSKAQVPRPSLLPVHRAIPFSFLQLQELYG